MPVLFRVDPTILDDPDARDVRAITFSYTFFPAGGDDGPREPAPTARAALTTGPGPGG